MKLEDILAVQIGNLTVENAKLRLVIEAVKLELAKRDELIRKLNEAGPELPLTRPTEAPKIEATNGKAH